MFLQGASPPASFRLSCFTPPSSPTAQGWCRTCGASASSVRVAPARVMELLDVRPALTIAAPPIRLPSRVTGAIRFDETVFSYPARPETIALGPVSFTVTPGDRVALVGP